MLDVQVIFVDILPGEDAVVHEEGEGTTCAHGRQCLIRSVGPAGDPAVSLGVPLVDEYLGVFSRPAEVSTVLAVDWKFLTVVGRVPSRSSRRMFGPAHDVRPVRRVARAYGKSTEGFLR